jgi:hypothetical protein
MQSVPSISTKFVSLNPVHWKLYEIWPYVKKTKKFVSDFKQVFSFFLWLLW